MRASVHDTPIVITEPAVPSARLLRLGSKPILASCNARSAKILLDSSSPREKQQRLWWLQKRHLESEFAPLQTLSRLSHRVQFVKCWWTFLELNSKGLYRRSRKEKESRCLVFTSCQREIRHLHVIVMQKRQRNLQKKRDARANLLFCLSNLLLFCRCRCRLHRRCLSSLKSNKGNEDSASRVRQRER